MDSQLVLCGQYFWHQGFFLRNNLYGAANLSSPVNSHPNWIYAAILKILITACTEKYTKIVPYCHGLAQISDMYANQD